MSRYTVAAVALASAAAATTAGAHPTGLAGADIVYAAAFGALIPLAASRASRETAIVLAAVATAMSRGLLWAPSGAALAVAFGSAWNRRRTRRAGALVGALSVQCALRWPPIAFHGSTALVASLAVLPLLVSAYIALDRRGKRRVRIATGGAFAATVILGVPFVIGVFAARGSVDRGITQAKTALDAATGGGVSAVSAINLAKSDLAQAASRVDPWWTSGAALVPLEAQQRRAVLTAVRAAGSVASSSLGVADRLGSLRSIYHDGQVDLARVEALAPQVHFLDTSLSEAQRQLAGAQSAWLVSPLASRYSLLRSRLDAAASSAHLADEAIPLLPGLLGGQGPRHYLVVFMTPSESRGLDGFIGSYAEVGAVNGHLSLTRNGPITQLSNFPTLRHISGYPQYLARYGTYDPAKYLQDVSYSPDFPTVANILGQLYPQAGGDHIDGVLALDPFGLASLLNFTGPISVPGLPVRLTAANAASELTLGQYEQATATSAQNVVRHDALQAALQSAFAKLTTGSLPSPRVLSATVDPAVRQGHIMFWSFHHSEQSLIRALGLSGAFPSARGGDLLAVTTQNADNNKIDAFLTRTINDRVRYNPGSGAVSATVTVTLHNAAPSSGLPGYLIGSYPGSHIPPGANLTWLTLYSPLSLQSAFTGNSPLPSRDQPELGVHAYGGFVLIGSGQTAVVTYHLSGHISPGSRYTLAWRTQPMDHPETATVELGLSPGWKARSPSVWSVPEQLDTRWSVRLGDP